MDPGLAWSAHIGPVYGADGVATVLGIAEREVHERSGVDLLALTTGDGTVIYPAYQFADADQPLPIIREALALTAGRCSPWLLASWLVSPNDDLGGAVPINVVEHGSERAALVALHAWVWQLSS